MSALLEKLLDPARRAECEASDAEHAFGHGPSGSGYDSRGVYVWANVRERDVPARERRSGPRSSRFADLEAV